MSQHPAFGRVFCYNKSREKKKFPPMNKYVKVAGQLLLGYVVYNHFKNDIRHELRGRKIGGKCGFRTSMPMQGIPNNGGL